MLQNLSEEIRECLRRAEECKRLSKTALTPSAIKDYLQMERRWLALAAAMNFQKGYRGSPNHPGASNARAWWKETRRFPDRQVGTKGTESYAEKSRQPFSATP